MSSRLPSWFLEEDTEGGLLARSVDTEASPKIHECQLPEEGDPSSLLDALFENKAASLAPVSPGEPLVDRLCEDRRDRT